MAQNTPSAPSLTTALQAAQSRLGQPVSARPSALSEGLVRQQTETPEIDFVSEAVTALSTLENAVADYQATDGKPNIDLLNARAGVNRLLTELSAAQARLALEEQKGSFLDRLNAAILTAESRVESLRNHYTRLVTDQILKQRFGQLVPVHAVSSDTKRELQLHVRITSLQKFKIPGRTLHEKITPESVYARAEKVAATLAELRQYIETDQANNAKK